jgi:hypothetical protein
MEATIGDNPRMAETIRAFNLEGGPGSELSISDGASRGYSGILYF